jgi:hypothetical protein
MTQIDTKVLVPDDIEFHSADGVFVKQMYLKEADILVGQHSHTYEHLSMLARGSVRVIQNGKFIGDFHAPAAINIPAHTKHMFLSLEPETIVYCIHNVSRDGEVSIADRHDVFDFGV